MRRQALNVSSRFLLSIASRARWYSGEPLMSSHLASYAFFADSYSRSSLRPPAVVSRRECEARRRRQRDPALDKLFVELIWRNPVATVAQEVAGAHEVIHDE